MTMLIYLYIVWLISCYFSVEKSQQRQNWIAQQSLTCLALYRKKNLMTLVYHGIPCFLADI